MFQLLDLSVGRNDALRQRRILRASHALIFLLDVDEAVELPLELLEELVLL